ncbi:MAG: ATP-binding protein [Elainellaceae cyanobacterium]
MAQLNAILRVLVIDDNPADRTLIIRELKRKFPQLQAQEILNAEALAAVLEADDFDAVITDYQIRWITGLEVLQAIKQRYPNCPVIMFTNTGNEEVAVEAMKAGLDDYVLKMSTRYVRLPIALNTALDRAEADRRMALLELRLQETLNQLSIGIFRFNSQGQLLECNAAFLDLLGVNSLEQAQALQALDFQALYTRLISLPPDQKPQWELLITKPDGTPLQVSLRLTISTAEGVPIVNGAMEDITALKQAEAELQRLNETLEERVQQRTAQLEAAVRDLEEFTYSVSHDLRAPLRAIQGFSQILLDGVSSPSDSQRYLQRISSSTQLAEQLIQDLLTYSHLSRTEIPLQPIRLSRIVTEILEQLEPELQRRQAQIWVEEPLAEVMGNRTLLRQIITNLITNAVKFVEPDVQPQVRIWTQANPETRTIRLWVEDNGIGIVQEYQERIFNVFVRLHSNEVYPGTGIGLAIVRKGVQRLGGRVGVDSQPGQGSRFWIELSAVVDR